MFSHSSLKREVMMCSSLHILEQMGGKSVITVLNHQEQGPYPKSEGAKLTFLAVSPSPV